MDWSKINGKNGHRVVGGNIYVPEYDVMAKADWEDFQNRLLDMINESPEKYQVQMRRKVKSIFDELGKLRIECPNMTLTIMNEFLNQIIQKENEA